jgi:peptidoglycan/LPS O-acetylase OafA/YrhL
MLLCKAYEIRLFEKFFKKDISAIIVILGSVLWMHFGWNDGIDIILFIGVVYAFALNSGRLHVICNNRIAQYLGKISYSIYLMQLFPLIPLWSE